MTIILDDWLFVNQDQDYPSYIPIAELIDHDRYWFLNYYRRYK